MKGSYDDFLNSGERISRDVKYNIFKFQDHLLSWISLSAEHFQNREYADAFEALTIVYMDSIGFFDEKEQNEITEVFNETLKANKEYVNYNTNFDNVRIKIKNQSYIPPKDIYFALLKFRTKLMMFMARHNMLMITVKKGIEGAGSQL